MAEQKVELAPGESKQVSFEATPNEAKNYSVAVNGLTGSFKANEALLPFNMAITKIASEQNKYATAYWLIKVTAVVSNPNSQSLTRNIRCGVADASKNPDSLSSYIWRYWGTQTIGGWIPLTLSPGASKTLVSPFYVQYVGLEGAGYGEGPNKPNMMYHGGIMKKYWVTIADDLGNMAPVWSVGTYV